MSIGVISDTEQMSALNEISLYICVCTYIHIFLQLNFWSLKIDKSQNFHLFPRPGLSVFFSQTYLRPEEKELSV